MKVVKKSSFLLFLLVFLFFQLVIISCSSTNPEKRHFTASMKSEGWINDNIFVVKAYGISDTSLVGDEAIANAKRSAVLDARQRILQSFRRMSQLSKLNKNVNGKLIVEIIEKGKIIHHNCKGNSCTIRYGVEFEGLKGLVLRSNLQDFVLIN